MIKPDGVRNGHIGEIVNRFERAGLTVERMELGMVTPEQAKANYAEHEGKPFYDGPHRLHHLRPGGEDGPLRRGRRGQGAARLMGATNPADAAPGTIRGDFGLIMDENVIHGSDSPESAEREIGIFLRISRPAILHDLEALLPAQAGRRAFSLGRDVADTVRA